MKKQRKTKAQNQTYHFKKRCDERLGKQIDRKLIQRRIKEQKFDEYFYLLNKQSNRVTRYRYKFQNKWYIIPYDKNTHKVITIFEDKKQDAVNEITTVNSSQISTWSFVGLFEYIIKLSEQIFTIILRCYKAKHRSVNEDDLQNEQVELWRNL